MPHYDHPGVITDPEAILPTDHEPGTLFDALAAEEAARAGIAQAADNATAEWKAEARRIIDRLAAERRTLIADDVWQAGLAPNPTGSNTALGHVFRQAAAAGVIDKTNRTVRTANVASHGRPGMTVWRSLVHPDAEADPGDRYDVPAALDLVDLILDGGVTHPARIAAAARRARPSACG